MVNNIIGVKFIRVSWRLASQRGIPQYDLKPPEPLVVTYNPPMDSDHTRRVRGLDAAHSDMERKISIHLKQKWIMDGPVRYINLNKLGEKDSADDGLCHLIQKMVKRDPELS